jgi:hypothetical protein
MKTSQAKGFLARSMAFALAALPAALLLRGAAFAADETQRVAVALMATARTPTYNVFNDNLNPVFRNAAANGTLAIVSNAQEDTRLNSSGNYRWMNYGTFSAQNGGPGLFGFDFSKLPRFAGATIHLAQFMIYMSNGNSGNRHLDPVVTWPWAEGKKYENYPGLPPAAPGASYAHPSGLNTGPSQDAAGGTSGPKQSWGPGGDSFFTWGTDTAGKPRLPKNAGGTWPIPIVYTVTDVVSDWAAGLAPDLGFCVWFHDNNNYNFYYREYSTETAPVLFIDYTPAPDTPVVSNHGGAVNVLFTTATLQGLLSSTGAAPAEVRIYYGREDMYPSTNGWEGMVLIGSPQAPGLFSAAVSGLEDGADYFYRCYARNACGEAWADPAAVFTTFPVELTVANEGPTEVTAFTALLNGRLLSTGAAPASVWVYLGDEDGGTDKSGWDRCLLAGENVPMDTRLAVRATGLAPETTYYYRYYAANAVGAESWAGATNFTTLPQVDYTAVANGPWNNTSTWSPSGYPQHVDDTATIAAYTVNAETFVIPPIALVDITTAESGAATGTLTFAVNQSVPLQLDGGVLKAMAGGLTCSGALTVKRSSTIDYGNHLLTLSGPLRDHVEGGVTNSGALTAKGTGRLELRGDGAAFSGGWNIPGGTVRMYAPGALGNGAVVVTGKGSLILDSGADALALPDIAIGGGCNLRLAGSGRSYATAAGRRLRLLDGSEFGWGWAGGYDGSAYWKAPLHVAGEVTLSGGSVHGGSVFFDGDFTNAGPATIAVTIGGDAGAYLRKTDNAYAGDWAINGGANIRVDADGAAGTGRVNLPATNSVLAANGNPVLNNVIAGNGRFGTLRLRPACRDGVLTAAGVAPGTSAAPAAGTLTCSGNLGFLSLTNYNGQGATARCRVEIAMAKDPLSGLGQASRLAVVGNLTGLDNADLLIKAGHATPPGLYTVVTAANDLSGEAFRSATFVGGAGKVLYDVGSVQVQIVPAGTAIFVR